MENLTEDQIAGLKKLMAPFDKSEISKLPKPTKAQTDEVRNNYKAGVRCEICGGWHHPKVVHLDYVGHAALTKRLLEVDPLWNWEPFAVNEIGEPRLDEYGGMWGWLTVCGVTRRGYGDAELKTGANANKERIGDFLRNAAMRFGAAIDLWSKADLTKLGLDDDPPANKGKQQKSKPKQEEKKTEQEQSPSIPGREYIDSLLTWVDGFIPAKGKPWPTPEYFTAAWESGLPGAKKNLSTEFFNELEIAYKDTLRIITENQGGKS